jgi:hypothetical protein
MDARAYYTVKLVSPADGWGRLPELTAGARRATEELRADGVDVRFLRSVFVPEHETCFYIYEATTADDVREATRRAGLPVERITEASVPQSSDWRREPMSEGSQR